MNTNGHEILLIFRRRFRRLAQILIFTTKTLRLEEKKISGHEKDQIYFATKGTKESKVYSWQLIVDSLDK